MCKVIKAILISATALHLSQFSAPLLARDTPREGVEAWRTLDEDFRQAIVDEISKRRGLNANSQRPDTLIRSPRGIAEALQVSCDLSGECADKKGRATLGKNLKSLPDYDEQQGLRNAQIIMRMKRGQ